MNRTAALFAVVVAAPFAWGTDPAPSPAVKADPAVALAAAIDRQLANDWAVHGTVPAAPADDAEFLRRVSLDLTGQIPNVPDARAFLDDAAPNKRTKLIQTLLASSRHADHFAALTRAEWFPNAANDFQLGFQLPNLEQWLAGRFREDKPYDETVRLLLTADVNFGQRGKVEVPVMDRGPFRADDAALSVFYRVADGRPEQMAAATTRLFLGIKLECAQCHDHPFAPYTQEQFWQIAAFFGEFTPLSPVSPSFVGPLPPQYDRNRISIPSRTKAVEKVVEAKFLDEAPITWTDAKSPRQVLAAWLTGPGEHYFARNVANRMWAHFFGLGLIDPVDESYAKNPPSHPDLLDDLTRALVASKYDLRVLMRAIAMSRAYQLTSKLSDPSQADPKQFARMNLKGLTGGTVYDCLATATGYRPNPDELRNAGRPFDQGVRSTFMSRFPRSGKRTETPTSILQALMLMNGRFVADRTSMDKGDVLAAVSDASFLDTSAKIETLFLAALCRKPTPDESERFASYVDRGGPTNDSKKALADVFWVLLNSTEFLFNH
ncbi:MAG TPA: DUF1549 and DUF1553 domain-containing protein [Fimbriiglobus sp.]|jgi:hypothetical protein